MSSDHQNKLQCSLQAFMLKRNTKPAKQTATQKKQMSIPILLTQPLFAWTQKTQSQLRLYISNSKGHVQITVPQ